MYSVLMIPPFPQISKQMGGVVKGLDKVVASMDLEKVGGVSISSSNFSLVFYTDFFDNGKV